MNKKNGEEKKVERKGKRQGCPGGTMLITWVSRCSTTTLAKRGNTSRESRACIVGAELGRVVKRTTSNSFEPVALIVRRPGSQKGSNHSGDVYYAAGTVVLFRTFL